MVITNETGQIQTKQAKTESIAAVLQDTSVRNALAEMLPSHFDANRFARIAMSSLRRNPQLLQCSPTSFLSALLQSAALGLEPDTALGHSYLIPYGKEATLIVGYEGYIDLAYRSGVVTSIHANVVRAGEEFEWGEGSEPFIRHKPSAKPETKTSGRQTYLSGRDVTHAYAIARLIGGGHVQVVMLKEEIDAIKSRSRASHDGPWVTDPVAMQKKTAIRQLRKFLPMSAQARPLHLAAGLDEQADAGLSQTFEIPAEIFETPLELGVTEEETKADTEELQQAVLTMESSDEPTEHGRCPVHHSAWALGKYGFSHRVEGFEAGGIRYCSPSKAVAALMDKANAPKEKDAKVLVDDLNGWLKMNYGITKSKVEPEHLVPIWNWLTSPVEAVTRDILTAQELEAQGDWADIEDPPEDHPNTAIWPD